MFLQRGQRAQNATDAKASAVLKFQIDARIVRYYIINSVNTRGIKIIASFLFFSQADKNSLKKDTKAEDEPFFLELEVSLPATIMQSVI